MLPVNTVGEAGGGRAPRARARRKRAVFYAKKVILGRADRRSTEIKGDFSHRWTQMNTDGHRWTHMNTD